MIYLKLFLTFFKIGAFTFGGGYAMIPLIEDAVIKNGWMDMEGLVNFIAVSESTPGPFAINVATYVGMETGGIPGALCATLGIVLPSFIIILLVAKFFYAFRKSKIVSGCMFGLKPAVLGLIGAAVVSVGKTVFFSEGFAGHSIVNYSLLSGACILSLMLILEYKKVHPIMIIILSGILGVGFGYMKAFI